VRNKLCNSIAESATAHQIQHACVGVLLLEGVGLQTLSSYHNSYTQNRKGTCMFRSSLHTSEHELNWNIQILHNNDTKQTQSCDEFKVAGPPPAAPPQRALAKLVEHGLRSRDVGS